jgi:N-acetyltransferase
VSLSGQAAETFARPGALLGRSVTLEPLAEPHREALRTIAALDQEVWRYFPKGYNGAGEDFDDWFDLTMELQSSGAHFPFAVTRNDDGAIIGTTRFYDMVRLHLRAAIGSTWYAPDARGSLVNSEVRLLTLSHAFDTWGVNRVELITDPRNLSSQAAMKILGAVQEGVIRSHLIYKDGRVRDSLLFSILKAEWPAVRQRLISRLGY